MLENKKILNEDELTNANGGLVVNAYGLPEYNPATPWEIIENGSGKVLGMFRTQDEACAYARSLGPNEYNAMLVDVWTVMDLRNSRNNQ